MMRSFVRLAAGSVLASWLVGLLIALVYARSIDWTETEARREGVFLVHRTLDESPVDERPRRLAELTPNFRLPLALVSLDEVERVTGRRPASGQVIHHEMLLNRETYYLGFHDGNGALAAGPINPAIPRGSYVPVGLIIFVFVAPIMVAVAFRRVQGELAKVQWASRELAAGRLEARVDNKTGPSNELATSFNEMAERIERLLASREELIQAVSHELGSPLSRLRFHVELAQSAPEDGRFDAMTRELDALEELVAELLRYVQSDETPISITALAPASTLMDLAELARLERSDGADFEVEVSAPEEITVYADPRLFQRAVENLLRNAMQHARGSVWLEVTEDEDAVRVAVHDDGPGVPQELREKVLAPFTRREPDRARRTGGIGLGLAIVNRIMQRHEGRVAIGRSPRLGGAEVATLWSKALASRGGGPTPT